jgi:assimilatory nitrate reductase catalytic subunit
MNAEPAAALASAATRTTCPYCGVGCGVLATAVPDGTVSVTGDPVHPSNFGLLCSKGAALGETTSLAERLLEPRIGGRSASWDAALGLVAAQFSEAIAQSGPDSVTFYVSGQLLTEDYYVANKLMKGFIGAANIDTNSRLCMASAVAGHRRAFGADTVPGIYADLELADLVVLTGSNLAWCHPVLFQRLMATRQARGTRLVVLDPRRTDTAEAADLHLPLKPGSDVVLFLGLLARLAGGAMDRDFVASHTTGAEAAVAEAAALGRAEVSRVTGVKEADLVRFYEMFAATERVVTVFSQGVNQSSVGTDKVNAIINCHLLTGRVGKPGAGPFSVTGQPNAMGGREVGGLANMLAAHMELDDPKHRRAVQAFWKSPRIAARPGLKAVELFEAARAGRIKALWIMATNPIDSMPDADAVAAALRACPFVAVSDVSARTDTAAFADVLLPAAAWGEKSGTVTNSERRISRQRRFLPPPGLARPDWWIVCEVAKRMGFAGFDYDGPAAIFREHAALSAIPAGAPRDFDIGGLAVLDDDAYDRLAPVQWPVPAGGPHGDGRFFARGHFFTADGRARLVPTPVRAPASAASSRFPLILNTGRIRDQWHTMTRTGQSPRLMSHMAEPFVEMHPDDAAACGVAAAELATVESARGTARLRVLLSTRQRLGTVFVPMHWSGQYAGAARADALVAPHVDPLSGQPEFKFTPVAVRRLEVAWYGFAVSASRPTAGGAAYWAAAPANGGWRLEFAGRSEPPAWEDYVVRLLGLPDRGSVLTYCDAPHRTHRFAAFAEGRLLGALFIAPGPVAVSRTWVAAQLGRPLAASERLRIRAGRGGSEMPDPGAVVCSCCGVGVNQIVAAVDGGAVSVDSVGAALKAGTNCGSCRGEIARLIHANRATATV